MQMLEAAASQLWCSQTSAQSTASKLLLEEDIAAILALRCAIMVHLRRCILQCVPAQWAVGTALSSAQVIELGANRAQVKDSELHEASGRLLASSLGCSSGQSLANEQRNVSYCGKAIIARYAEPDEL